MDGRINSGRATANKMTPEQRKERALKGVEARKYKDSLPSAKFDGKLNIVDLQLDVAVLDNEKRVITQQAVWNALDRPSRGNARIPNTPVFMDAKNLQPFISNDLKEVINKIEYVDTKGNIQSGYDATILPLVADLYLKARENHALTNRQLDTALKAEILVRTLAKVGITALVDEATGYQDARAKDALAKILEEFVAKELQPWLKTFPDDYYKGLFRLYDIEYPPVKANFRPQFFGNITNKIIYDRLAPELLPELKKMASKEQKRARLHQFLSENVGHPKLREHLASIVTLMKISKDKDHFFELVDTVHPEFGKTIPMDFGK